MPNTLASLRRPLTPRFRLRVRLRTAESLRGFAVLILLAGVLSAGSAAAAGGFSGGADARESFQSASAGETFDGAAAPFGTTGILTESALFPQSEGARPERPVTIRVGVLAYSPPWYDGAFVDETIRQLAWRLPQYDFDVVYESAEDLRRSMAAHRVDVVISPESFLALTEGQRLHALASIVSDAAGDSSRSVGAAVVVRRDRTDLATLADLKGRTVAAVEDEASPGLIEVLREAARFTDRPDEFFCDVLHVPRLRMKEVLSAVMSGRADAGILRACFLEDLWRSGNTSFERELRVIDSRKGDGLSCRHSTALYPGWTIAALETLPQEEARALSAVLLTKAPNAWGQHWTVSTNVSSYTDLMKTLRIGPYAYLREWTLARIWSEYRLWILLAGIALVGLFAHSFILEQLVRRRTWELERLHAEQQAAERHAREMTERIDQLQRAGAVGQISTIVAHEMKQPLAIIQNLARGTERMIEDEPETLDEVEAAVERIEKEAGRAAAIIDRVRGYSQGRANRRAVPFAAALTEAVLQFRATRRGRLAEVIVGRCDQGEVWMDPLDLELVVVNLLANAVDACRDAARPRVRVDLRNEGDAMVLAVEDNGPRLSDAAFAALEGAVLKSTKADGLGLGLSIVRTIASASLGRLSFERAGGANGGGVRAVVRLPVFTAAPEAAEEKTHAAGTKEGGELP